MTFYSARSHSGGSSANTKPIRVNGERLELHGSIRYSPFYHNDIKVFVSLMISAAEKRKIFEKPAVEIRPKVKLIQRFPSCRITLCPPRVLAMEAPSQGPL